MKRITAFLLSLNTVFGIFSIFMFLLIYGSLSLSGNLALFSGIDEIPLFKWLQESGVLSVTWWIYLMIIALTVLALSTVFCTADAMLHKVRKGGLLYILPPQVMHAGVLFIMLGHLLTAASGDRKDIALAQGEANSIAPGLSVTLNNLEITKDKNGYDTDWTARLSFASPDGAPIEKVLKPVDPVLIKGFNVYIKTVSPGTEKSILIKVTKDPGALWALAGGLVLSVGGLMLLRSRIRR